MILAFLESVKYVGHLVPLALLRVFIGYFYLNQAIQKYEGDFLIEPRLADMIATGLAQGLGSPWYRELLQSVVIPQWKLFAGIIVFVEFLIGISYLLGYLIRPVAVAAVLISLFYLTVMPSHELLLKTFIVIHITLAWLGAGRCLGFDYYFYKRHRGIWW